MSRLMMMMVMVMVGLEPLYVVRLAKAKEIT